MESRVVKWGNSLAIRIPRSIAAETRLEYGASVEVQVEDGAMVVRRFPQAGPTRRELLRKVTKANLHGEIATGRRKGREVW